MTDFKRLGDIATYINGYAFKPEDRGNEGLPIIRIQDLTGNSYDLGFYNGEYPERIEINNGDVLISWSGSLGVYLWNKGKALLNQHIFKVVFDKAEIDKSYFIYAIQHYLKEMEAKTHGATMKHITKKDFDDMLVPYPNMQKQRETAGILSMVDGIIVSCQQELTKLDELVKSRFVEMFGMPGADDFGWGLVTLGSVCYINPKKSQDTRLGSGIEISFVPMPAVTEHGEIDATSIKEYDEVRTGFTYFAENDVLFAKITPCMENGKGAIARGLHNGIGFGSTEFHVLRPIADKTNPYWIYILTVFSQFREDAAANMTGSAGQRRVPASFLENYRIAVPPIELQNQFAAFVAQVDKSKFCIRKTLHLCRNWWTKLLHGGIMNMDFFTQRRRNK